MNRKLNNYIAECALSRRVLLGLLFAVYLLLGLTGMANAAPGVVVEDVDADFATGLYKETAVDMRVKVMGGFISAKRTWYNNRWEFNYSWSDLHFEFKKSVTLPVGVPSTIRRNFMIYELVDAKADTLVWRFNDKRKTITKTATGYRWADRDGNWKEYDEDGKLLKYGDRNNVTVSFTRHLNNKIEHIKDHFDKIVITYEYNADDEVSRIIDYTGREVTYTYVQGKLTEVKDVLGYIWKYGYKDFTVEKLTGPGDLFSMGNMLTTKTDPENNVTKINYTISGGTPVCIPTGDGYWRVNPDTGLDEYVGGCTWLDSPRTLVISSIEYPDGRRQGYTFSYTGSKKLYNRVSKDASGRQVEEWVDLEGIVTRRLVNGKEEFSFVKDGTSEIITNALGHQTRTDFDQWRNPLKVTYPDQSFKSWKYETTYSNVVEEVNENGVKTSYEYDDNGNLTRMTEAVGKPEQRITEYTYDNYGNILTRKRLGDAVTEEALTTYSYDDYGNVKTKTVSVSTSESHTINYLVYDVLGNLLEWRDARNKLWKQTFDNAGNRKSVTNPLTYSYSLDYDGVGNLVKVTDQNKKSTQYIYSAGYRLDKIIDPTNAEKRYVYNTKGQIVTVYDEENHTTHRNYDSQGRLSQVIDGAGNTTSLNYGAVNARNVPHDEIAAIEYPTYRQELSYDSRGQLTQTVEILDTNIKHVTQQQYNEVGNLVSVTDAEQKTMQYRYDALNRLIQIINPDNTSIKYTYDNRDNLLSVTNEKQVIIRRYTYDRKNRLSNEIWPYGEGIQYNYDANDNIIEKIDAKGQVKKYTYDDSNRLSKQDYFSSITASDPIKSISFTYDVFNNLVSYDDGQTSANYRYDLMQRRIEETINFDGFSKSIRTAYYKNGLKKSFTGPDDVTINYAYNGNNQLSQITLPGEGAIIYNQYTWLASEHITYPGGSIRKYVYDPLLRIKNIVTKDPANNILLDYKYTYDRVSNVRSKVTEYDTYNYDYDSRDRLISVNDSISSDEKYTYDEASNRLTSRDIEGVWQYNDANQLKANGSVVQTYDLNGNIASRSISEEINTYSYNLNNQLVEVKSNTAATIATYYYDPFGRRLWKEVGGIRTYFLYTEEGIVAEMDAAGIVIQSYGYEPQSEYGTVPLYTNTRNGYSYYQLDHLGTPQQLVNKAGQIQWRAKAQSFGLTLPDVEIVKNNIRSPGQYYDAETELHYNYFRYYDPKSGAYITSDPDDISGGLNTYIFVENDPINQIDPYGLKGKKHGKQKKRKPKSKKKKRPVSDPKIAKNKGMKETLELIEDLLPESDSGTYGAACNFRTGFQLERASSKLNSDLQGISECKDVYIQLIYNRDPYNCPYNIRIDIYEEYPLPCLFSVDMYGDPEGGCVNKKIKGKKSDPCCEL